jgi:type IV secretory pathway VirB2 component (pilin)
MSATHSICDIYVTPGWCILILLLCTVGLTILPDFAYASPVNDGQDTPMGAVLCTIVPWFAGNVGKGLAVIAVITIGIGALNGKVSWGLAILVGIGVAIIFSANMITDAVDYNTSGKHDSCDTASTGTDLDEDNDPVNPFHG